MLAKAFQGKTCDTTMLPECLGVDENVVKIHTNNSFCNGIVEDVIHHCLEGGRAVGQIKEHYQGFEKSTIGPECCLPLITFLDVHIVVAPVDIQLGEVMCTSEIVNKLGYEWKWVAIFDHHCIQDMIILN